MIELTQALEELNKALDDQQRVDLVRRYLISRIEELKLFNAQRRAVLIEGVHFTIEQKAPSVHCTE